MNFPHPNNHVATHHSQGEMADLLITTSRSLLLLDPRTGSGFRLDGGKGTYYGIATLNARVCAGARGRLSSSPEPVGRASGQIIVFDEELRPADALRPPFPMREIHQILGIEGTLWVTCTFDNFVAIYDGSAWERWYPLGKPCGEPYDVNHFNSLSFVDGKLCVLANNHDCSELLLFNLPERRLIESFRIGHQAHNVWKQGRQWMTCSSSEGRIIGHEGFSLHTGGFPRGISFVDDAVYVGISECAERPDRDLSDGHVAIYDSLWNRRATLQLTHEGIITDLFPIVVSPETRAALSVPVQFPLEHVPSERGTMIE